MSCIRRKDQNHPDLTFFQLVFGYLACEELDCARMAQRYIERLDEIGILREVTGQARNRLYRVDEFIEALESNLAHEK